MQIVRRKNMYLCTRNAYRRIEVYFYCPSRIYEGGMPCKGVPCNKRVDLCVHNAGVYMSTFTTHGVFIHTHTYIYSNDIAFIEYGT